MTFRHALTTLMTYRLTVDALNQIPPVTRYTILGVAAVTLPVLLQLVSPYWIVFLPYKIFGKFELWRLITPLLYGGKGMPLIFDTFLLYRNMNDLEERHFQRRTADFVWAISIVSAGILGAGYLLGSLVLFRPFLLGLTHLWAQSNPTGQVSLFGFVNIPSTLFPFALLVLDMVQGGPQAAISGATGIAAAHLYWFLTDIYPRQNGGRSLPFLATPQFLINLVSNGNAPPPPGATGAQTGYRAGGGWAFRPRGGNVLGASPGSTAAPRQAPVAAAGSAGGNAGTSARAATTGTSTYRWGSGNRLGES